MAYRLRNPKKDPASPCLPDKNALTKWHDGRFEDEVEYSELLISDVDLSGQLAKRVEVDKVEFDHVGMRGTQLPDVKFRDVRFRGCDVANAQWRGAFLSGVEIIDSKILGLGAVPRLPLPKL
jgi:uncharacterized protein YjbI with pentapeptide repeats